MLLSTVRNILKHRLPKFPTFVQIKPDCTSPALVPPKNHSSFILFRLESADGSWNQKVRIPGSFPQLSDFFLHQAFIRICFFGPWRKGNKAGPDLSSESGPAKSGVRHEAQKEKL
jgi:hypothetical protein